MLKPLGDRVIIGVTKKEEGTVGGIALASAAKEKPWTRTVVTVGEDRLLENGEKAPAAAKVNDQVMFEKYTGTEVKYEGRGYLIVAREDVMATVE